MTNFKKRVATVLATGALMINSVLPVMAQSTSLVISGNGANTNNDVNLSVSSTTNVTQNNTANISNDIDADADTGNNSASYNTGGNQTISTGNASTGVGVSNSANSNVASLEGCCEMDTDVELSGNGYGSDNTANLSTSTATNLYQTNNANIENDIDADADTGDNKASYNTGGDTEVLTGDADTTVLVNNEANSNWARIAGGEEGAGSLSLRILGNGANSDNDINLGLSRSLLVTQANNADISNDVDADADTGDNKAKYNTGGDVVVGTGDATVGVGIDNMANFNFADLDCGCLLDVFAKIDGNGVDSDSTINAALADSRLAFQNNEYDCGENYELPWTLSFEGGRGEACNDVDADADTGDNKVKGNTAEANGDPSVFTGNADALVEVENTANSNVLVEGGSEEPELPEFEWDFDFGGWSFWAWLVGMGN
jgi:hypothetical protein